jgi:hypothetical protein
MKTMTKTLATVGLSVILIGSLTNADAQKSGRGNGKDSWQNPGKGHDKGFKKGHDKKDNHDRTDRRDYDWSGHRDHDRRTSTHVRHYHHDRYASRRPAVRWVSVTHNHVRPRYIFYQDYNVYYDCNREVFMWLSNGRWVVSVERPIMLHRVNLASVVAVGVDYYADDFTTHAARKRPVYFSIRAMF